MDDALLEEFDELIARRGYSVRSEAIRDLVRAELAREQCADPEAEVVGTLTMVYNHHDFEHSGALTRLQHEHHDCVVCTTHVHLDAHDCLEIVVLRGPGARVRAVADGLVSRKGVRQGHLATIPVESPGQACFRIPAP